MSPWSDKKLAQTDACTACFLPSGPLEGLLSHSSYTMEGYLPPRTTLESLLTGLSPNAHVGGLSSGCPDPPGSQPCCG